MCTALSLIAENNEVTWGRTLDFAHVVNAELVAIPEKYKHKMAATKKESTFKYRVIGGGKMIDGSLVLVDGVNEKGLSGGALYFPGFAYFHDTATDDSSLVNVAATEFIVYCLANFGSIDEVLENLNSIYLVGVADNVTKTVAPLHWMFTDKTGRSVVIEHTSDGYHVHENEVGVMTNSPDFNWHVTNLRNYVNVNAKQKAESEWGDYTVKPFGQASGLLGLPGDYTPPARFVRTAYQRAHIEKASDAEKTITLGFQILKNVSIPKGIVINVHGKPDYTQYTAFIDLQTQTYYYNTYNDIDVHSMRLQDVKFDGEKLIIVGKMS